MRKMGLLSVGVALLLAVAVEPAQADLSACVATVGFDEDANLERGMGFGVRWGRSTGIIGGETSLLIAFPERELAYPGVGANVVTSSETAKALFYEGRFMLSVPVGQIRPFVGVGLGAVTILSTDVPSTGDATLDNALDAVAGLQTSTSVSYGGGAHYALSDRFSLRLDLRQYLVLSVKGLAASQAASQVGLEADDETVQYTEMSLGVNVAF